MSSQKPLSGRFSCRHIRIVKKESGAVRRQAPIDLISFPADSDQRFIRPDGTIQISFKDVRHVRC